MTPAERAQRMRDLEYAVLTGNEDELHKLFVDGHCPTGHEAKRILTAPAPAAVKDISTASISSNRGFSLMR